MGIRAVEGAHRSRWHTCLLPIQKGPRALRFECTEDTAQTERVCAGSGVICTCSRVVLASSTAVFRKDAVGDWHGIFNVSTFLCKPGVYRIFALASNVRSRPGRQTSGRLVAGRN